jgi:hypothetical protein
MLHNTSGCMHLAELVAQLLKLEQRQPGSAKGTGGWGTRKMSGLIWRQPLAKQASTSSTSRLALITRFSFLSGDICTDQAGDGWEALGHIGTHTLLPQVVVQMYVMLTQATITHPCLT